MKILRIIYDWPPPWGGLSPHPYELTKAQVKLGHEFNIFCGRWPSAGKIEKPEGVKVTPFFREPLPGTISFTTSVVMFFYYLMWRMRNSVDLIHSHGHFGIWIYWYRRFLKKFFKNSKELETPLVVHFHNTVEGRKRALLEKGGSIKSISRYLSWPLATLADKWAVETATVCIFVSNTTREEAIKYYNADPKKCFVVESGVNMQRFFPIGAEEREKTRKELGLDALDKVVLNLGAMVERKNIHLLVEAIQHLPESYKLLLVGSGDSGYTQKLTEQISKLKLTDRVVRVGYTPYPQVPIAYQAADIFVLPSMFEGLPKAVMESLSCGVPALVSGFKLSEELRGLYYLSDLNSESIAKSIRSTVEDSQGVDLGKLHSAYSWDMRARAVEKIYESVKELH